MSLPGWSLRRLHALDDQQINGLASVLMDCVEGGASVSFMQPLTRERAVAFWRGVAQGVSAGQRALLVAQDALGLSLHLGDRVVNVVPAVGCFLGKVHEAQQRIPMIRLHNARFPHSELNVFVYMPGWIVGFRQRWRRFRRRHKGLSWYRTRMGYFGIYLARVATRLPQQPP